MGAGIHRGRKAAGARVWALSVVLGATVSLALVLPSVSGAARTHLAAARSDLAAARSHPGAARRHLSTLTKAGLVYMTDPEHGPVDNPTFAAPRVWSATTDGSDRHNLGKGDDPLLSPNGRYVLAVKPSGTGLTLYRAGGGVASRLTPVQTLEATPLAWSPDSRYVALSWSTFKHGKTQSGLDVIALPSGTIVARVKGTINGASFAPTAPDRLVLATAASQLLRAKDTIEVLSHEPGPLQAGSWRITRKLIRNKLVEYPLWGRYGIVYDTVKLRGVSAGPVFQLVLLRHGHSTQITHTHPSAPVDGLVAVAFSANGKKLVANFNGTDTDEAYAVNVVSHQTRELKLKDQEVSGYGISPSGSQILVDYGAFESASNKGRVATIPFSGGTPKVLVRGGVEPGFRS